MAVQIGHLDDNGHPRLKIRVSGTNPGAFVDVDALIDTGFSGFLMPPLAEALPLGLVLYSTGTYHLADGTPVTYFLAKGTVSVASPVPESRDGVFALAGDGALLGMEFLRSMDRLLVVGKVVALIDHAMLPDHRPH